MHPLIAYCHLFCLKCVYIFTTLANHKDESTIQAINDMKVNSLFQNNIRYFEDVINISQLFFTSHEQGARYLNLQCLFLPYLCMLYYVYV